MRLSVRSAATACILFACIGCFPTVQTARIDPGFRLELSATVLDDQRRNGRREGIDVMAYVAPAYGFGRRVEVGIPVGFYGADGISSVEGPVIAPYAKLGLLGADSRNHLALIAQTGLVVPTSVGVRYGRDLGAWEPHMGATYVFSTRAGDGDYGIARYQQSNQTLIAWSIGATINQWNNTAFELGVLMNRYDGNERAEDGTPTVRRATYYDAYVGMRVNLTPARR